MWFLLLIKYSKIVSKLISKLANQVLTTNILDSKLVSKGLIETNSKHKYLVAKILLTNN